MTKGPVTPWTIAHAEVKEGSVPWVFKVEDSTRCIQVISTSIEEIMNGANLSRPCPNLTRWRFTAINESPATGGPYCWTHLRQILNTPEEIGRIIRLINYRQQDQAAREAWYGR